MRSVLIWLLLSAVAVAEPRTVEFRVQPADAVLLDRDTQAEIARASKGRFDFTAETDTPHHYRIERPPFDGMDFTVQWESDRWKVQLPLRQVYLDASLIIGLSRTVGINTSPPDAMVYCDAEAANSDSPGEVLDIAGLAHKVVRLPEKDHQVVIPNAWVPPLLYLVKPGFLPHELQIPEGTLEADDPLYPLDPVALQPRFGWFSYPGFNIVAAVLGVGTVLGWALYWRPRQVREQTQVARERELLRDILAHGSRKTVGHEVLTASSGARYVLLGLLGQGGMGAVYEATPVEGGDPVAIKMLIGTDEGRFEREADICRHLAHPAIVKVLDWGVADGRPFMVMERLHGTTLRDVDKPVAPELVVAWLQEMLRGLAVAHKAGIVHRDLKPDNLMLTPRGHIKIMDFGVAHRNDENLTESGVGVGTPKYMSPEHFRARTVTPASDIYSLGMVGFELLTGQHPFEGEEPWSILVRQLTQPAPDVRQSNARVPERLAAVILKMTAPDVEQRYQTADQVLADLDRDH